MIIAANPLRIKSHVVVLPGAFCNNQLPTPCDLDVKDFDIVVGSKFEDDTPVNTEL